ncbi:MAG: DNA replication/repair protein RecF [Alphaproteobacteria bacterium]|nr:DNA replication/repair protein RecF [Alphaproteobacteria bacterium]
MVSAPSLAPAPSSQPDDVSVTALRLGNFRNYMSLDLAVAEGPVVLYGPNGAGKTNILEAISLLAPGRGLRRARAALLPHQPIRQDATTSSPLWSVSAEVMTADGPISCGTGTMMQDNGDVGRRVIKVNGEFSSQTTLAEHFAVSWMTPDMDDVLAAAPSERRRFLDRLVIAFDPAHAGRLQRYEKLYRQRNRLLEEGQSDASWYDALETQMAASGIAIIAARQALVDALDQEASAPLPMFPSARLFLDGEAEDWLRTMPAVEVEDRICDLARRNREAGQSTMPGPMSSVLQVVHSGTGQVAEMSSTGEQKALVISVILAHARLQHTRLRRPPILLLDDIASHLDGERRQALFELTAELRGQVWFSGTDLSPFRTMADNANVFSIEDGQIAPHNGFAAVRRS